MCVFVALKPFTLFNIIKGFSGLERIPLKRGFWTLCFKANPPNSERIPCKSPANPPANPPRITSCKSQSSGQFSPTQQTRTRAPRAPRAPHSPRAPRAQRAPRALRAPRGLSLTIEHSIFRRNSPEPDQAREIFLFF